MVTVIIPVTLLHQHPSGLMLFSQELGRNWGSPMPGQDSHRCRTSSVFSVKAAIDLIKIRLFSAWPTVSVEVEESFPIYDKYWVYQL